MLTGTEWAALGVGATLLCGYIADKIGWIQINILREAHTLNVRKATPRINSRVEVQPFHPIHRPDVTRYAIRTKIYNDGDLVARNLEGEWKLTASHGINDASNISRSDSLPSFLPLELEHKIVGNVPSLWTEPKVILQVNINLTYLGLNNSSEQYCATYDYDF